MISYFQLNLKTLKNKKLENITQKFHKIKVDCKKFNKYYKIFKIKMKILCYHGVTKYKNCSVVNFSKKHISKNEFYQQIKYIKKNFNILSIEKIYTHMPKKFL